MSNALLDAPVHDVPAVRLDGSRRRFIAGGIAGLAGFAAAGGATIAADEHKDHSEHAGHQAGHDHAAPAKHQALIDVAFKCVNRGVVCTDHCLAMLGKGDTSLKDCVRKVGAMIPLCEALAKLAALEAPHLGALAKLCIDVCEDCEKECKKHGEHHAACKACADSCRECIDACKKVT